MADYMGAALKARREALGWTQRQAAQELGFANTYLSQLETGKVGLPSAEVRRRIARFIGVSHVDLLIGIGELTHDELEAAGKVGVPERDPNDPAHDLHALIDQVNWYGRPDRVLYLKGLLDSMLAVDRQYKEEV